MINKKLILSILIATIMVASSLAAISLVSNSGPNNGSSLNTSIANNAYQNSVGSVATTGTTTSSLNNLVSGANSASTFYSQYLSEAKANNVPLKYLYLPAAPTAYNTQSSPGSPVLPGYAQGPAPFGIGAYGIKNVAGNLTAYNYSSNGFQTNLNVSQLNIFDVNSYNPNALSVQLNTILNGTTIQGVTGYTYWTQNVASIDTYDHQFQMEDNIWNFSSYGAGMPAGTITSGTAPLYPYSLAYIAVGQVIHNFSAPFNLTLTLESTVIGGSNVVFFNYSVSFTNTSTGLKNSLGGVFDEVTFNSLNYGLAGVQGYTAPMAKFLVDGSKVTPMGFINYDAESTIEGPGGGSQINIANIAGNMTLKYNNSGGKYVNVPSAYNVGSETGETSTGIAEAWSSNGVTQLSSGPSMIYGMWNVSAYTGTTHYTGTLAPSNAFMFVAPGTSMPIGPNVSAQFGYVPMTTSGSYSFYLPSGTYNYKLMLSDYAMKTGTLSASAGTITLTHDVSAGVYTPLYALNNAQLANISSSGAGTPASPYVAVNNQVGYINPLFGLFSDYGFQVFSGVMLSGTTANINFNESPSFKIMYQQDQSLLYMGALYGMGAIDYLGYVLYNTADVSIYNASLIGGDQPANWMSGGIYYDGFFGASLILWNSTHDLVANSTFINNVFTPYNSELLIYNPPSVVSDNLIIGNQFEDIVYNIGIEIGSSNNMIFNNYFDMQDFNIYEIPFNLYSGLYFSPSATYQNAWNATPSQATGVSFNGYTFTGNILGGTGLSGNYWNDNFGAYSPPFSDNGDIAIGGDYSPLTASGPTYYPVLFYQTGLPVGDSWSVTMGGVTHTSTSTWIDFMALPGTYSYTVQSTSSYTEFVTLFGGVTSVTANAGYSSAYPVFFSPSYTFTVNEVGLPNGYAWGADINDAGAVVYNQNTSSTTTVTMIFVPGEYLSQNFLTGYYYPQFEESVSYTGSSAPYLVALFQNITVTESFSPIYTMMPLEFGNPMTGAPYSPTIPSAFPWTITVYSILNDGTTVPIGTYNGSGAYNVSIPVIASDLGMIFDSPSFVLFGPNPQNFVYGPSSGIQEFYAIPAVPVTFDVSGVPSETSYSLTVAGGLGGSIFNTLLIGSNYNWFSNTITTTDSSYTMMVPTNSSIVYTANVVNGGYSPVTYNATVNTAGQVLPIAFTPSQATVTFSETGLSSGATWQVTFNGQTKSSTTTTMSFATAPGTYYYQVYSAGMVSPQSSGSLNVQTASATVAVTFSPQTYNVTFVVAGLPTNQEWNVTFNGQSVLTNSTGVVFNVAAGTYNYSVAGVSGYHLSKSTSSVTVAHNTVVVLTFSKGTSAITYLAYAGLVGLGALVGVLLTMFLPKAFGKKGGQ